MTIEVRDLSTLNIQAVKENQDLITEMVRAENPDVEVKRGPLHDLLFHFSAMLATANQANMFRARQANSMQAVIEDPTLVDDDVIENILANWRITRRTGVQATGVATIVLSAAISVSIPINSEFTDETTGVIVVASDSFTSRLTPESVIVDTDRLLTELPDGTFSFTILVTAKEVGTAGNLSRDVLLCPESEPPNFVRAFTSTDLSGGVDEESNAQVAERLSVAAGTKALSNRTTYESTIQSLESFENTQAISVVGYGDEEQRRDRHSVWVGNFGGRVDVYARTMAEPTRFTRTYTATLISKTGPIGTWQFSIGRDDIPGFYEVVKITREGYLDINDTFAITSEIRSYDITGAGFIPDITTAAEAAFSRFQTATIQFQDIATDATSLTELASTAEYDIEAIAMFGLDTLQAALVDRDVLEPVTDVLVRGPVPCFMETEIEIEYNDTEASPDEELVKQAVVDAVNSVNFGGRMPTSTIANQVRSILSGSAVVKEITLSGQVRRPDNTLTSVGPTTSVLVAPDDPSDMVSGRTVIFFQPKNDVTVTLSPVSVPPI